MLNQYSILIDLIPINIAVYKVVDGEFIFIDLNIKAQETEKISKEELIGRKVTEVFPGIHEMGLLDVFVRVYETGVSEVFDITYYSDERISSWRKNTVIKLDENTIIAVYEDVSALKGLKEEVHEKIVELTKTTNELEEKTADLQKAQKIGKIGSWKYHILKDILIWSDETYNIFQIDKIKYPIRTLDDFFTKVDSNYIEESNQAYSKHLKDGTPYEIIHELILEDGTSKWIKERCETIYDSNSKPIESNGILQDITEDIEMKNNISKKDQQLIQQSKMAQMGEMISMIAHQWRQPLNIITLNTVKLETDILFNNEISNEEIHNVTSEINKQSQYLSNTIDDFRYFYKPNKELETVKLEDVVSKSLSIMKASLISSHIEIIQEYKSKEEIELYDNEVMQVILNILKNAQDNFQEKDIKDPCIKITTQNRTISICDNGGGIPEDIIEKIFDLHFSTKDEKSVKGLGLYMSKTIIENHHDGILHVENKGDGVCFIIEL